MPEIVAHSANSKAAGAQVLLQQTQQLYEEHSAFLARMIMRFLGDGSHVDDLLQEVFIVAFQKSHSFDASRGSERAWLYGIAANLCKHHRRGLGRFLNAKKKMAIDRMQSEPRQPDEVLNSKAEIALVQAVVESLSFKQREVFVLYELEGIAGEDIAKLLEIPVGTVWTRLHKARKQFRSRIERKVGNRSRESGEA